MGICRKIPLAIVYSPTDLLGLGFTNIYLVQGIKKLKFYLEEKIRKTFVATFI